jgi:exopolysaccharide production protein ExoQ
VIYNDHPHVGPALQVGRPPWLTFLFLAAVFLLAYHDPSYSKKGADNINPSEEEIVTNVAEGSPVHRLALLSLGPFAIGTLVRHRANGRLRVHGSLGWILLCFAVWALLSPIWAEDLALTTRRLVVCGIVCIAAVAIAYRFSLREIVLWTLFSTTLFLVIGFSVEVLLGTFRPFASGYRFAGTLDPNNQGVNCALLLLSGVAAADVEKHRRILFRACALVGFVFLILTASRTSFAAALLSLAVYLGAVCSRATKIVMAYSLCMAFCILLLVPGNALLPDLKSAIMLGRNDSGVNSFHGRTGVWEDVGYYIRQRPILGYGYGGFWTPAHIGVISDEEKWGVPNSHSAYLDYLLTLGVVGLVAYICLLFAGIRCAFRFQKLSQNSAFASCGALLVFCASDGFLESAVVGPSFLMFLGCVVLASLAFKDSSHTHRFCHLPSAV